MDAEGLRTIRTLLAGERADQVRRGLAMVEEEVARAGPEQSRLLFDSVSDLFSIDPLDRPDLVPVLDQAVSLVAGFGSEVIPRLIERLDQSDLKAQMAVAHAATAGEPGRYRPGHPGQGGAQPGQDGPLRPPRAR